MYDRAEQSLLFSFLREMDFKHSRTDYNAIWKRVYIDACVSISVFDDAAKLKGKA